jgi:predicted aspartyl protease
MRAFAISILALAAAAAVESRESVSLRLVRGRLPVVSVRIDDQGPFDFLLDTGSSATVLGAELAASLRAEIGRIAPVATTLGPRGFRRAEIRSISLGGLRRGPLSVLVSDLREVRRLDSSLQGVLGLDFLAHFDFLIDYRNRRLEMSEAMSAVPRGGVSFRREAGRILVPVETGSSSAVLWLVLDTGADGLVLTGTSGVAVERDARRLARIDSAGGSAILRTGALPRLRAGSVTLARVPVTLIGESRAHFGSASGLLPGRLFRRLFVSPSGGYVVFEPDT